MDICPFSVLVHITLVYVVCKDWPTLFTLVLWTCTCLSAMNGTAGGTATERAVTCLLYFVTIYVYNLLLIYVPHVIKPFFTFFFSLSLKSVNLWLLALQQFIFKSMFILFYYSSYPCSCPNIYMHEKVCHLILARWPVNLFGSYYNCRWYWCVYWEKREEFSLASLVLRIWMMTFRVKAEAKKLSLAWKLDWNFL